MRHEIDLAQAALAALLGKNEQAVALWKKSKVKVPAWADRLMRVLYREHMGENVKIRKLIEAVAELENSKAYSTAPRSRLWGSTLVGYK